MFLNQILKKTLTALLLTLFLSSIFSTANAEKDRKGPPKGKPPEAAFTACSEKSKGGACSFSTPEEEEIEGTCKVPRKTEASLVCRPSRGKHKGKRHMKRD